MNSPASRFLALMVIFSAASGFSDKRSKNANKEVSYKETEKKIVSKILADKEIRFYFSKDSNFSNSSFRLEAEKAAENSASFEAYKSCFLQSVYLEEVVDKYRELRLTKYLCRGVVNADATMSCFEMLRGKRVDIINSVKACRGLEKSDTVDFCVASEILKAKSENRYPKSTPEATKAFHGEVIKKCLSQY